MTKLGQVSEDWRISGSVFQSMPGTTRRDADLLCSPAVIACSWVFDRDSRIISGVFVGVHLQRKYDTVLFGSTGNISDIVILGSIVSGGIDKHNRCD